MKLLALPSVLLVSSLAHGATPNIILVMADDMGWGQTGYYNHPVLKTPHLDAMAAAGLRFDRFYAGAPNCSPTRATVMTGRSNDRAGVEDHGFPLRRQETTIAQVLKKAGYATGHFGKWHLNGLAGPGAPVLAPDNHNPGEFGFDTWLSATNFFDLNPILGRKGKIEEFTGDSSEIIVREALAFMRQASTSKAGRPFFTVIWYGSPHAPFRALEKDGDPFAALDARSRDHYGELAAMDRSIGTLRKGLREMGIADNTLVWFNSDNGGLPEITPSSTGGLRGFKNTIYEGGLRVPGIIEWPSGIKSPRITSYPAGTVDIFATLAEVAGLPASVLPTPGDGESLVPLFGSELKRRSKPLPFRHTGRTALIDNDYKILTLDLKSGRYELYNLAKDPKESQDLFAKEPEVAARMKKALEEWNASAERSFQGRDYKEGRVDPAEPGRRNWMSLDMYKPYFEAWKKRPEYEAALKE